MLELAEKGLMDAEDAEMRDRLIALKLKRADTAKEIAGRQKYLTSAEPVITPEKIARLVVSLREKLHSGPV